MKDFSDCLIRDRHLLRQWRTRLQKAPDALLQQRFDERLAASQAAVQARQAAIPEVPFPEQLPVVERLDEVREGIAAHQVLVLCGETGSGKSTQLPKICLSLGLGVHGRIGHTQPRRIAARTLANRVASELGQEIGQSVGYKVRFADKVGEHTQIKLMTDGMLLAEIQRDRYLNDYQVLIIDEAHERSLNIDFLLGYLHQLLPKRPDLKVIITSATIDPKRFSRHFNQAPVIEVSGRTFPVEVWYREPPESEEGGGLDLQQGLLDAVDELSQLDRGDILVFLPGEREIREAAETLRKHQLRSTEILPLYARQSPAEQARIFKPGGQRHIVLATNVAETSLTVPGIRYVIDTGTARISRYSARSKIQRLPVEAISQASANQRTGRCGRVAAGVCIRLYSEQDFAGRDEFTDPEIHRTNLASVILQMLALGFGEIERFPFVDPPDNRLIKDGYRLLHELGALDGLNKVTRLGRKLARLPIDPRVGRMLLEGAHNGCLRELLIIGAALSVQDPRERPLDKQQQADEAHAQFFDERSDFSGSLKLWHFLEENRQHLTRRKFDRLCRTHFLAPTRVREWRDIHQQLKAQMHELGYKDNSKAASYESIHQALLAGLLSHIGHRSQGKERDYLGARNTRFHLFPGSALFKAQPKWVVSAELVETTKLYARGNAQIQPEWVENLAAHLVKRSYSEPHWQARRGQVGAYEKVSLYGLPIVPRRRVNYGPIDPKTSRDIFIRFGLVEGELHTRAPFWRHNQQLIADLHDEEAKTRRRDLLVDEEAIYAYYAKRIHEGIYSTAQLEQWLRKQPNKKTLFMRAEDIRRHDQAVDQAQFPDHITLGDMALPLTYHFEPGSEADGVTVHVPLPLLPQLTPGMVDWLVPGLIEDKVVALIKSLPKALRRHFVPAPQVAHQALAIMQQGDAPLHQTLAAALKQLTGVHIAEDQWQMDRLDPFMQMRIGLLSADGEKLLSHSRDLQGLQKAYAGQATATPQLAQARHAIEQDGITQMSFPALPDEVETRAGNLSLRAYPALVDDGEAVSVRCLESREKAQRLHRQGLRRLLMLQLPAQVKDMRKSLSRHKTLRLAYSKVPSIQGQPMSLEDQILALAFEQAFLLGQDLEQIRSPHTLMACYEAGRGQLQATFDGVLRQVEQVLLSYQTLRKSLSGMNQLALYAAVNDMQQQLDRLVYQGFLLDVPMTQLEQYSRYLKALQLRVDKLASGAAARDQLAMREMASLHERWAQRDQEAMNKGVFDSRLEEIRWQLEELRISLFAQEVKTQYPVSVKRIEKHWQQLGL